MEPNGQNQDRLPPLEGGRELWGVIGFAPKKNYPIPPERLR